MDAPDVNVLYGHDLLKLGIDLNTYHHYQTPKYGNHTTMSLEDFNGTNEIKPSSETFSNHLRKLLWIYLTLTKEDS